MEVTFVIDPRRSLMAGTVWLVTVLAASFACAASLWVGSLARDNVLEQHERRLALETEQLAADLGQAVRVRVDAVRAAELLERSVVATASPSVPTRAARTSGTQTASLVTVWAELQGAYPELDWIALADADGRLVVPPPATATAAGTAAVAATGSAAPGGSVAAAAWFQQGANGPWLGVLRAADVGVNAGGDLAIPVHGADGALLGVVAARLGWAPMPDHVQRLNEATDPREAAEVYVIDRDGRILVGPAAARDWPGVRIAPAAHAASPGHDPLPSFERLPDGRVVLVAKAAFGGGGHLPGGGPTAAAPEDARGQDSPEWPVLLAEPRERVYRRADALGLRIWGISIVLGTMTALVGAVVSRRLTRRLAALTESAAAVGRSERPEIDVPAGHDEAARLGRAFAGVLDDLRRERSELCALSEELERRVALRTREVERLAEESRYAAIVRERLKLARDLHDTLAHSMMAMLSEIRLLRRLQTRDPGALAEELGRAEQVAQDGLNEARNAIAQMRLGSVRDMGLGAALAQAVQRFMDHTGIEVLFTADPEVARFGDERGETLFRMIEEALRNVERHAQASQVAIRLVAGPGTQLELSVEDNGIGFDVTAPHPGHYGLVGLREQAQLIGAELSIESGAARGTRLRLSLRMAPEAL